MNHDSRGFCLLPCAELVCCPKLSKWRFVAICTARLSGAGSTLLGVRVQALGPEPQAVLSGNVRAQRLVLGLGFRLFFGIYGLRRSFFLFLGRVWV